MYRLTELLVHDEAGQICHAYRRTRKQVGGKRSVCQYLIPDPGAEELVVGGPGEILQSQVTTAIDFCAPQPRLEISLSAQTDW